MDQELVGPVSDGGEARPRRADRWRGWFHERRDSPRLAFLLRAGTIVASSLLALLWSRLLVRQMGNELYGLFLSFLAVTQLGGAGDFGLSTAVGLRVLRDLAQGREEATRRFLATGRAMAVALAIGGLFLMTVCAPLLPRWLHFEPVAGAGSLTTLFLAGGVGVAVMILNGYWQALNYACGNVTWPIVPLFLLTQAASATQWWLATRGAPLWQQYLPAMAAMFTGMLLTRWFLSLSHPSLAVVRPLAWEKNEAGPLVFASFWTHLYGVGSLIFLTTDRLVINAFIGAAEVPAYRFNYRLPELFQVAMAAASFSALPTLVRRILHADVDERRRGLGGARRLQIIQVLGGCLFGQLYLLGNDLFIRLWLGPDYLVPLSWQTAFATTMAMAIAGEFAINAAPRLREHAIRLVGGVFVLTALLNLGLSVLAGQHRWILGIALATIVAQLATNGALNWLGARFMGAPPAGWVLRATLLPMSAMALAGWARWAFPFSGGTSTALLLAANVGLLALLCFILGVGPALWREEWTQFRKTLAPPV